MERTHMTVSENGQGPSAEAKDRLGVPQGGEVELVFGERSIELQRKWMPLSEEEARLEVEQLHTLFRRQPGEPSLEDDLHQMRREEEEEHARRKYGC